MLAKDAVILNGFDPGGARFAYGFVVDHFILQPKVRNAEADDVVRDGWHKLRGAEDVNQIDSLACFGDGGSLCCVQVGVSL